MEISELWEIANIQLDFIGTTMFLRLIANYHQNIGHFQL